MADFDFPRFPDRALMSIGVLYSPLQDIQIYVEDENFEAFYSELLSRLVAPEVRIKKVFGLRGRERVIEECEKYTSQSCALFLIDGDLDWVAGIELPSVVRLFVHPCYCVENYLFCETAMIELIVESTGTLTRDEVSRRLGWSLIRNTYMTPLVDLFVEFAVVHLTKPELNTVSTGVGVLCTQEARKKPPELDHSKIESLKSELREAVVQAIGAEKYKKIRDEVERRVAGLQDPFDAVSGKAYLIPFQMFTLKRFSRQNIERTSFLFRLSKYCRLDKLGPLKKAIFEQMKYQAAA